MTFLKLAQTCYSGHLSVLFKTNTFHCATFHCFLSQKWGPRVYHIGREELPLMWTRLYAHILRLNFSLIVSICHRKMKRDKTFREQKTRWRKRTKAVMVFHILLWHRSFVFDLHDKIQDWKICKLVRAKKSMYSLHFLLLKDLVSS